MEKFFLEPWPYVIRNFPVSNKRAVFAVFPTPAFLPVLFPAVTFLFSISCRNRLTGEGKK